MVQIQTIKEGKQVSRVSQFTFNLKQSYSEMGGENDNTTRKMGED
jgi:hypothetical protein